MIVALIAFSLVSMISVNIAYAQQVFPSSTIQLRKAASGMTTVPSSSATTPPKPEEHITKIKITSPSRGQQVPVGKDLILSGTSIDNTSANDCKVSVREIK